MPDLYLYSLRDGNVQRNAGLNWGFSDGNVSENDAYIAITASFIRSNPTFFPINNNVIIAHWDDGRIMECLLEGTQNINNTVYPKQISSNGDKSVIGVYLRGRLGIWGRRITRNDLRIYGRDYITVTHLGSNDYAFDFHI